MQTPYFPVARMTVPPESHFLVFAQPVEKLVAHTGFSVGVARTALTPRVLAGASSYSRIIDFKRIYNNVERNHSSGMLFNWLVISR